jgi:hypothetical protein|nr:MAG TPA: hypothetical protein [Caudoviricetes sp.]
MARAIDADELQELCNRRIRDTWNSRTAPVSWAAAYADFKDDIDSIPTLTPPNEPLTLEELRRMDGEPVWVSYHNRIVEDRWYIIEKSTEAGLHVESHPYFYLGWDIYGKFWLAYRRPPEEEEET